MILRYQVRKSLECKCCLSGDFSLLSPPTTVLFLQWTIAVGWSNNEAKAKLPSLFAPSSSLILLVVASGVCVLCCGSSGIIIRLLCVDLYNVRNNAGPNGLCLPTTTTKRGGGGGHTTTVLSNYSKAIRKKLMIDMAHLEMAAVCWLGRRTLQEIKKALSLPFSKFQGCGLDFLL